MLVLGIAFAAALAFRPQRPERHDERKPQSLGPEIPLRDTIFFLWAISMTDHRSMVPMSQTTAVGRNIFSRSYLITGSQSGLDPLRNRVSQLET